MRGGGRGWLPSPGAFTAGQAQGCRQKWSHRHPALGPPASRTARNISVLPTSQAVAFCTCESPLARLSFPASRIERQLTVSRYPGEMQRVRRRLVAPRGSPPPVTSRPPSRQAGALLCGFVILGVAGSTGSEPLKRQRVLLTVPRGGATAEAAGSAGSGGAGHGHEAPVWPLWGGAGQAGRARSVRQVGITSVGPGAQGLSLLCGRAARGLHVSAAVAFPQNLVQHSCWDLGLSPGDPNWTLLHLDSRGSKCGHNLDGSAPCGRHP